MKQRVTKNRTRKQRNDRKSIAPSPARKKDGTPQRINQILSLAGLTSRRNADQWIKSGRIRVNSQLIHELGTRAIWGVDKIEVDDRLIPAPSPRIYILLNKPFGYVCSLKDPEGRHLVTELLTGVKERVYPVGRLDFDSLGLLLLTNDGEFAFRMTHPRYQVPRTYKVTIAGEISERELNRLGKGVQLEDGPSGPAKAVLTGRSGNQSTIRLTITQGRSRQVRRMMEAVGTKVVHLVRISFGMLSLGDLKIGAYRYLETTEVDELKRIVGLK